MRLPTSRPSRRAALALGLVALAAALAACGPHEPPPPPAPRPVLTTVVGETSGSPGATYSGTVQARFESKLGFQTSGKVTARLVDVGSRVRRGQVLMRLDPAQQTLHVESASAELEAADSRVQQRRTEVDRTSRLLAQGFASQAELERERQSLAEAEASLQSAAARRQAMVNQRGWTTLVADRDGVIAAVHTEVGQVIGAGQAAVTLAADAGRDVVVSIPESRVHELQRATTLRVTLWAQPGRSYAGRLRELSPDTDRVTSTYAARIAIDQPDAALRLGMTASVFAPDVGGARSLRVPLTAIHHDRSGQAQVWVLDEGRSQVTARPVSLGAAQQGSVVVTSGLSGGESIVTAGVQMLNDGDAVKPVAAPTVAQAGARP